MIRAEIPQNVSDYKEEIFLGLTTRQLVSLIAMLLVAVPLYLVGKNLLGDVSIVVYGIVFLCFPIVAVGFLQLDDMPFEKAMKLKVETEMHDQRRKMIYEPEEMIMHDEIVKVLLNGEAILYEARKKEEKRALKASKKQKPKKKGK